jgi:hypothetical protein
MLHSLHHIHQKKVQRYDTPFFAYHHAATPSMHKTLINNGMQQWMHNEVAMAMKKKR